jgi:hypothetical protein
MVAVLMGKGGLWVGVVAVQVMIVVGLIGAQGV